MIVGFVNMVKLLLFDFICWEFGIQFGCFCWLEVVCWYFGYFVVFLFLKMVDISSKKILGWYWNCVSVLCKNNFCI